MKRVLFTILAFGLVFGLVAEYQISRDSAPTPDGAVRGYIGRITQNAPHKVESIFVVSSDVADEGSQSRLILFRATEADTGVHMAGYAISEHTIFGWHIRKLQMTGRSPLPQDMLAQLDWSDEGPVLFGEVFLPSVSRIEAVFDDPNAGQVLVRAETTAGNFMLHGPRYGELLEARLLDSAGNLLRLSTPQELSGDSASPEPRAEPALVNPTETNRLLGSGQTEFRPGALPVG